MDVAGNATSFAFAAASARPIGGPIDVAGSAPIANAFDAAAGSLLLAAVRSVIDGMTLPHGITNEEESEALETDESAVIGVVRWRMAEDSTIVAGMGDVWVCDKNGILWLALDKSLRKPRPKHVDKDAMVKLLNQAVPIGWHGFSMTHGQIV